MVLDNADDDGVFFSGTTSNEGGGPLASFLPQAAHGLILITSRNGLAARNLVGSNGHVITVQPMNEEESLALLRAKIPARQPGSSGDSGEDEKGLVRALEYVPLAITQAAAYITTRLPLFLYPPTFDFSMKASQSRRGFSRMRTPRTSGAIPPCSLR